MKLMHHFHLSGTLEWEILNKKQKQTAIVVQIRDIKVEFSTTYFATNIKSRFKTFKIPVFLHPNEHELKYYVD